MLHCMNTVYICVLFCSSDTGKESMTRLEFKQRLSIAIGAAKGCRTMASCPSLTSLVAIDALEMPKAEH